MAEETVQVQQDVLKAGEWTTRGVLLCHPEHDRAACSSG